MLRARSKISRAGHNALGKKILSIPEALAEAIVSPDCIADDLGRETIAGVTKRTAFHSISFSGMVPS